jgi:O-6-methylguanine DNA methyltransferase
VLPAVLVRVGAADRYARLDTAIGPVFVAFNRQGVSAVAPVRSPAGFEREFAARTGRRVYAATALPGPLARAAAALLHGPRRKLLRVDLRGLSAFEQAVLRKTMEIPRGEVRPYSWVAREIGRPRAARAVGTALSGNPIPVLIPCHRVVRSSGRVGEYALGPQRKCRLLEAEGVDLSLQERMARAGTRYVGSDTTHIYCYPTCHRARRIAGPHRVPFRAPAEAAAAGYRPCKICRPARAA